MMQESTGNKKTVSITNVPPKIHICGETGLFVKIKEITFGPVIGRGMCTKRSEMGDTLLLRACGCLIAQPFPVATYKRWIF